MDRTIFWDRADLLIRTMLIKSDVFLIFKDRYLHFHKIFSCVLMFMYGIRDIN